MSLSNRPPSNLAYPNVSFTETIAGPLPLNMGYRNTIGVAGVFNRGPEGPTLVTNRNEVFYLFGEDDSPGSIFVQQAMYQGATRFIISRVVPEARPAAGTIVLQPLANASIQEAFVANNTQRRLVGLGFEADYVTPPIMELGDFVTEPVEVKDDSYVALDLQGSAVLQFQVKELLQAQGRWADTLVSPPRPVRSAAIGRFVQRVNDEQTYQIISFTQDAVDSLEAYAKPGRILVLQATTASTVRQQAYSAPTTVTNCIDASEGKLYFSSTPGFVTGQVVYVSTSGANLPAPLSALQPYWVRVFPNNVVTLHTSFEGATGNVVTLDKVTFADLGSVGADLTLTPNVARLNLSATTVDTASDIITLHDGTNEVVWPFETGDEVRVSATGTGAALPGGLNGTTSYFVRKVNSTGTQIKLFATRNNALNNTSPIDLTSVGTGMLHVLLQQPQLSLGSNAGELEVASYPFFHDGYPSIMVRGKTELHSGNFACRFREPNAGEQQYYTFQVAFIPTESVMPGDLYPVTMGDSADFAGVLIVHRRNRNWLDVSVFSPTNPANPRLRLMKSTGVKLRFGARDAADNLDFIPNSRFGVGLARTAFAIGQVVPEGQETTTTPDPLRAFPPGLPAAEILNSLARAIRGNVAANNIIGEVKVNVTTLPYSLTFETNFSGASANRVRYRVKRYWIATGAISTDPQDVLLGPASSTQPGGAFDGVYRRAIDGADPMLYASRILYDANGRPLVLVRALSPGRQGNNIRISIRPLPPGQWRLEVYDDSNSANVRPLPAEAYILSNYSVDPQTAEFQETLESRMVRCYFIPLLNAKGMPVPNNTYDLTPQRLAPPVDDVQDLLDPKHVSHRGITYLRNIYLQGGKDPLDYDPVRPQERDVVQAVRRLEQEDVAILALPGVIVQDARYEAAVSECIRQAENSTVINGLRIAVLQAPPEVTASRAEAISKMVVRSDRVVILSGHVTMAGYRHLGINRVPADGYYCGTLAMIQPHFSPAAASVAPSLVGVVTTDTKNVPATLDAITRAGLEAVYYDPGLRQHKFLNGITTSLQPANRYVCVRRQVDQMITDLAASLQWVRSMPHTFELRRLVASSVDAYLRQLLREERIYGFRPTICDESNNTMMDISQGRMNIKIIYTPIFPADFIRVDLVRDLTSEFSVSTAAGQL